MVSTCASPRDSHAFCFSHQLCSWEYFTTLWFEWEVLTKRRQWKPTMLVRLPFTTASFKHLTPNQIYFGSRLFCLGSVCTLLAGFNLTSQFNCQAWLDTVFVRCLPSWSIPPLVGLTNPSGLLLPIIYAQFVTHPASNVRDGPSTDKSARLTRVVR
jgi:hypothetical protein